MKHTSSRILFGYWDGLRGERIAPDRTAIEPGAIRHILPDVFILGVDDGEVMRFRLAGSRLSALFGRDLHGDGFAALWPRHRRAEAEALVDTARAEPVGLVAGLVATNVNGSRLPLELLLLPLRHRGRSDRRLLGVLSPASLPAWAGLVPVADLEVTGTRIVRTTTGSSVAAASAGRRASPFVVHQGGLA